MARPKRTDPHLRIAHSILEELFCRHFTSRQLSILLLILRLSWGCGKEFCVIPYLRDFELCGVHRSDIALELRRLVAQKVIFSDYSSSQFAFNKDFDQWQVSRSLCSVGRQHRLSELLSLNLSSKCPVVGDILTELLVFHPQPVGETPTEPATTPNVLNKHYINSKENTTSTGQPVEVSKNLSAVVELYEQNIGLVGPLVREDLIRLSTDYRLDWIREAFREAVSMNKRSLKYIEAILDRWGREGYKAPLKKNTGMPPGRPPKPALPSVVDLEKSWKGAGS